MKRIFLLFLCLITSGLMMAEISFNSTTKYRISCKRYNASDAAGSVVLGANHNSSAELYYLTTAKYSDDSWWYIRNQGSGYVFVNAKSGEYMTFTTAYDGYTIKNLALTSSLTSDCVWNILTQSDGYAIISSNTSNYVFDLRTNLLLGTYHSANYGSNELFKIYDEQGNDVLNGKGEGSGGGSTPTDDYISSTYGTNSNGEYWERTQLTQPVVYTTNTTNPVLYSIVNLRSGRYVGIGVSKNTDATCLVEENDATNRAQFYFVKRDEGVQIFTKDGLYVSTNYPTPDNSLTDKRAGLSVVDGTPDGNIWTWGWANVTRAGYTITKLDNLSSSDATQFAKTSWNDYSLDNNSGNENVREIGLWDANDDGSTFVFTSSDIRHAQYLKQQGIDLGLDFTPKSFDTALDSFLLGNKQVPYDSYSRVFYYPLPESVRENGNYTTSFRYTLTPALAGNYKLSVNDQEPDADGNITIDHVNCDRSYSVALKDLDGNTALTGAIRFTFLPVVEVNDSYIAYGSYTNGTIRLTYPESEGLDSVYHAAFKVRGASSQNYPKKSYAVKLRDAEGNSIDRKMLGLRSDNNWILDAMYIDLACMRNRVCTDIWNDFAVKPYYADREKKVRTGTRGKFVEMILNGRHNGLYCMTEKMDRKQLKLKKFVPASESSTGEDEVHGLLYKSTDWTYETFMGHEQNSLVLSNDSPAGFSNRLGRETWRGYEFKYPDYQDEAVDWEPLYNAVNHVAATKTQSAFDDGFETYFDYPLMRDFYLFLELILATDNHGKNMLFYVYDKQGPEGGKIAIAPWDMDGTLGQRWDGSTSITGANQDFDQFINANEHGQYTPFLRLKLSSKYDWRGDLSKRYAELRQSGVFDGDNIANRIANYAELFEESAADAREEGRWGHYHRDLQSAASYAESWIRRRVNYLDDKYGYDPSITQINEASQEAHFNVTGGKGSIAVTVGKAQLVRVYSTTGALLRTEQVSQGFTLLQGIAPGIYIVNGVKVMVE